MAWADHFIRRLRVGETVQFRPRGGSMAGRIESGQLVTVAPITTTEVKKDDIVLCMVNRSQFLHLVKDTRQNAGGTQYLIGNNRGGTNGWIGFSNIFGICTKIEK